MVNVCGRQGIDKVLKDHNLDALVSPTAGSSFPASIVRIAPIFMIIATFYRLELVEDTTHKECVHIMLELRHTLLQRFLR